VQQGAQATSQAVDKLNATNDALAASFTKSGKPIQTAANGMRFFTDATGRARKENGQFVTTAEAAAAGLQKQGKAAQQAGASVSNFGGTVRALLGSFALIQSARFVFAKTAELESQTRSLQVLAGSAEKAGKIIKELQDLGAVTPFTSTELIDSAKRLQAFGIEADKVVETTRRLADASGATGAELSGLVTAYGQVQAKGRLQGEEMLQFQERGIALQEELRKMYGMTGEEFQKALSKGQVSAKAVEVALVNLTSVGGKYANGAIAQSDTLQGRLSTLQDGIDGLARGIGTALSPAIKAVLNEAIFAVNVINNLIATGARAKSFGLGDSQRKQILNQAQTEAQQIVEGRRIKDPFERNRQFQELAGQRERDLIESYGYSTGQVKTAATAPQMATQVPGLLGATAAGGGGGRAGGGGAGKAANDAKRAAEQAAQVEQQIQERLRGLIREVELIDQIAAVKELQFQAEMDGNKELQIRLQGEERIIQIMQSTAQALDDITDERLKQNILAKAESEIASARLDTMFDMQRIEAERTKSFDAIIAGLDLELALKSATTEQAREQLRLEAEIAKIRGDKSLTPEQQESIIGRKTELARPKTDRERLQGAAAGVKAELDALTDPINMITTAAAGIGDAFSTSFKGVISGSMTAKEALASFFTSVADMFLDMAAQIIAKMIQMAILNTIVGLLPGGSSGGIGSSMFKPGAPAQMVPSLPSVPNYSGAFKARAKGGPVSSGQTYMVGERGPELFVPGRSGTIIANDKMGGGNTNVVVNVDAKGSSVEGDEQGANQLGRVISAAVQSELIKQQRPGGILAR
jgi:tape measure domain-containing protein